MAYPAKNTYAPAKQQSGFSRFIEIAVIVLVIVTFIAGVFAVANVFTPRTGETEVHPSYIAGSIGRLRDEDGILLDNDRAIVTKNLIECTGFCVTPQFTSVVNYQVHFYAEDNVYIGYVQQSRDAYSVSAGESMPCLKLDEAGNPIYDIASSAYENAEAAADAPVAVGIRVVILPNSATAGYFNNDWYDIPNHVLKNSYSDDMVIVVTQK